MKLLDETLGIFLQGSLENSLLYDRIYSSRV